MCSTLLPCVLATSVLHHQHPTGLHGVPSLADCINCTDLVYAGPYLSICSYATTWGTGAGKDCGCAWLLWVGVWLHVCKCVFMVCMCVRSGWLVRWLV